MWSTIVGLLPNVHSLASRVLPLSPRSDMVEDNNCPTDDYGDVNDPDSCAYGLSWSWQPGWRLSSPRALANYGNPAGFRHSLDTITSVHHHSLISSRSVTWSGIDGHDMLAWFSLRQCWQHGMAFARPVNASLYRRALHSYQFRSCLAKASHRYWWS